MKMRIDFLLFGLGGLVICLSGVACAPTYSQTPMALKGEINGHYQMIQTISMQEAKDPDGAMEQYQEFLEEEETEKALEQPITYYQELLQESLTVMQASSGTTGVLPSEAGLGFPSVYARKLEVVVRAHQGLGKLFLAKGNFEEAEKHATRARDLMTEKAISPAALSQSLLESNQLLHSIAKARGQRGAALIAKLNADLLKDHLMSEGGVEDFYVEKELLFGEKSQQQMAEVTAFVLSVNSYRAQKHSAQMAAIAGGLMQANAAFQTTMANQALAKSGGVMTPQVQQMQMNAQMAQFQSQMFTMSVQMSAGQTQNLTRAQTPWALPKFGQQLVDPKMGVNPHGIIKGFVGAAVKTNQTPSLQTQAQAVTQQVDALAALRQAGGNDAKMQQLTTFADVFNTFLTLVQEIK